MALFSCPECENQVSSTAKSCVHCGYRFKRKSNKKKLFIFTIIPVILLCISIGLFQATSTYRSLPEEEKIVLKHARSLKKVLLNPKSLDIERALFNPNFTDGKSTTLFTFTAETKLGELYSTKVVVVDKIVYLSGFDFVQVNY